MLRTFAASAATAVALAQSVRADRLRSSLAAADAGAAAAGRASSTTRRSRDSAGLRVAALGGAAPRAMREPPARPMREAVERIELEIGNLRAIITELRPAALDELGLRAAIEALLERQRAQTRPLRSTSRARPLPAAARGTRLEEDRRDRRLPAGPGGAHERRQARRREQRERARSPRGRASCSVNVQDDGGGFDPQAGRSAASGWPACASASRSPAGSSASSRGPPAPVVRRACCPPAAATARLRAQPIRPRRSAVAHQLGARRQPELLVDVRAVGLDRARGEVQLARDFDARVAERDQPQHLDLALGSACCR